MALTLNQLNSASLAEAAQAAIDAKVKAALDAAEAGVQARIDAAVEAAKADAASLITDLEDKLAKVEAVFAPADQSA